MSGTEQDPYQVLGLGPDATGADVIRAWRRLARAAHPDSRPGDPGAAERFRAASDAYGLLSDPARRAAWDHEHRNPPARRQVPPGQRAPASSALWPVPPAAPAWPAPGQVPGATLRAGPVHIQPPAPASDEHADPASSPPRLQYWLAFLEWPW